MTHPVGFAVHGVTARSDDHPDHDHDRLTDDESVGLHRSVSLSVNGKVRMVTHDSPGLSWVVGVSSKVGNVDQRRDDCRSVPAK